MSEKNQGGFLTHAVYSAKCKKTTRKGTGEPTGRHFEVYVDKHNISCRTYFYRIAKFGEDILNHSRAIKSGRFPVQRF